MTIASDALGALFATRPNASGSDIALAILSLDQRGIGLSAQRVVDIARAAAPPEHQQYVTYGSIWRGLLSLEKWGKAVRVRESYPCRWRLAGEEDRPGSVSSASPAPRPSSPAPRPFTAPARPCALCGGRSETCDGCSDQLLPGQHAHAVLSGKVACDGCAQRDWFREATRIDARAYDIRIDVEDHPGRSATGSCFEPSSAVRSEDRAETSGLLGAGHEGKGKAEGEAEREALRDVEGARVTGPSV